MEQKTSMGTFRVKYKETGMYSGPSSITNYLGTLRKGATLDILDDSDPYYFMVRVDGGEVGYVYRDAGEVVGGLSAVRKTSPSMLSLSKDSAYSSNGNGSSNYSTGVNSTNATSAWNVSTPETPTAPMVNGNGNGNGVYPIRSNSGSMRPATVRTTPARPATPRTTQNGMGVMISSANRPTQRAATKVAIISGEIAVFDKPGIVGTQVGKLRRGEQVALVAEDDYFYCVTLPNGNAGYIPRYAAEPV